MPIEEDRGRMGSSPLGPDAPSVESQANNDHAPSSGGGAIVPFKPTVATIRPVFDASQGPDMEGLLTAFRRRWPLAILLGVCSAVAGAGLAWKVIPASKYTARSLIKVATTPPKIVFDTHETGTNYHTYQRTQVTLVKSRTVLNSALRNPKVAGLESVREQTDPVEWLEKALIADFPGGSEILQVTLSGDRPQDLAILVNAVIDSYMDNVVNREARERLGRHEGLKKIYEQYQSGLELQRKTLKETVESLGTSDKQTLALKQQFSLDHLAQTKAELMQIQSELRRAQIDLETMESEGTPDELVTSNGGHRQSLIDEQVDSHPSILALKQQLGNLQKKYTDTYRISRREDDPSLILNRRSYEDAKKSIDAQRSRLRPAITARLAEQGQIGQSPIHVVKRKVGLLKAYDESIRREMEQLTKDINSFNKNTLDLQSQQDQMAIVNETAKRVGSLVEAIEVEFKAPARIEVYDRAEVPRTKDEMKKVKMTAASGLGTFALVVVGITFLESRAKRIRTPEEVVRTLGMSIVGSLPSIPDRLRRKRGRRGDEQDRREMSAMTESINAARTMLIHASRAEAIRVVMITSAMKGEGKTSLSGHLAASLSNAGYRTLLIDCDLRSPTIHRLFDMETGPGIAELLRREVTIVDVVRPTVPGGPFVITGGKADAQAIQALAHDELDTIFRELKRDFDYILVDSAPILPVADSLLISQRVDAVIFSILRDVSRIPKVYAAYERLAVLGVRMLGAVISGTDNEHGYY